MDLLVSQQEETKRHLETTTILTERILTIMEASSKNYIKKEKTTSNKEILNTINRTGLLLAKSSAAPRLDSPGRRRKPPCHLASTKAPEELLLLLHQRETSAQES